ncbi:LuxR C-terminal-related transcriptional regulator [Limnohabitans sp.]|jgi:DNA-binding NarL/FixJ family response regulator|uniref:LuxR C-terminal-related transcriptional regulator n=1 Tax=Limnohabitans sp. TaxID=1907725 RepID=UPI00391AD155
MTMDVVLADPHPVVLDGLEACLQAVPGVQVRARVTDGEAALQAVAQLQPDCLVLDLPLRGQDGLSVIQTLQAQGARTRPVVFTAAPLPEVMRVIDLGVRGLVAKDKPPARLVECLQAVQAGKSWLDEDLTLRAMTALLAQQKHHGQAPSRLTERELSVARLAVEGLPNKLIARRLNISEGTIKLHLHHVYQKLNCTGRMGLAHFMQTRGWPHPPVAHL